MSARNSISREQFDFPADSSSDGNVYGTDSSSPEYSSEEEMECGGQNQRNAALGGAAPYQRSETSMKRGESYLEMSDDSYEESYVSRMHDAADEEGMVQTVGPVQQTKSGCNPALIVLILCIIVGLAIIAVAVVLCIVCNHNNEKDVSSTTKALATTPSTVTTPGGTHAGGACDKSADCYPGLKCIGGTCAVPSTVTTTGGPGTCDPTSKFGCLANQTCLPSGKCESTLNAYFPLQSRTAQCGASNNSIMTSLGTSNKKAFAESSTDTSTGNTNTTTQYALCNTKSAEAVFPSDDSSDFTWEKITQGLPLWLADRANTTGSPLKKNADLLKYTNFSGVANLLVRATCDTSNTACKHASSTVSGTTTATFSFNNALDLESSNGGQNNAKGKLTVAGAWSTPTNSTTTANVFELNGRFTSFTFKVSTAGWSFKENDTFQKVSSQIQTMFSTHLCTKHNIKVVDCKNLWTVKVTTHQSEEPTSTSTVAATPATTPLEDLDFTTKTIESDDLYSKAQCISAYTNTFGWANYSSMPVNCSKLSGIYALDKGGVTNTLYTEFNHIVNQNPGMASGDFGLFFSSTELYSGFVSVNITTTTVVTTGGTTGTVATTGGTSDTTATVATTGGSATDATTTAVAPASIYGGVVLGYLDQATRVIANIKYNSGTTPAAFSETLTDPTKFIDALTNAKGNIQSVSVFTQQLCDDSNPCEGHDPSVGEFGMIITEYKTIGGVFQASGKVFASIAGVFGEKTAPAATLCTSNPVMQKTSATTAVTNPFLDQAFFLFNSDATGVTTATTATSGASTSQYYCAQPVSKELDALTFENSYQKSTNFLTQLNKFPMLPALKTASESACTSPLKTVYKSRKDQAANFENGTTGPNRPYKQCLSVQKVTLQSEVLATYDTPLFDMIKSPDSVVQFGTNFIVWASDVKTKTYAIFATGATDDYSTLLVYPVDKNVQNAKQVETSSSVQRLEDLSASTSSTTFTGTGTATGTTTTALSTFAYEDLQRWTSCVKGADSHPMCSKTDPNEYVIEIIHAEKPDDNPVAQLNFMNQLVSSEESSSSPVMKFNVSLAPCTPEKEVDQADADHCTKYSWVPFYGSFVCTESAFNNKDVNILGMVSSSIMSLFGLAYLGFWAYNIFDGSKAAYQSEWAKGGWHKARAVLESIPGVYQAEMAVRCLGSQIPGLNEKFELPTVALTDVALSFYKSGPVARYEAEQVLGGHLDPANVKVLGPETKAWARTYNSEMMQHGNYNSHEVLTRGIGHLKKVADQMTVGGNRDQSSYWVTKKLHEIVA